MKKMIFFILLVFITTTSFAQIYQGQWMVGGNLSLQESKYGDVSGTKITQFNTSPDIGYFFINNFAGGLRFTFNSAKLEGHSTTKDLLAAPFVRYYFLQPAEKVNVFLEGHYGFGSTDIGLNSNGTDKSKSFNQFGFMAGPAVFLTSNVALELGLFYNSAGGDAYKNVNGNNKRYNNYGFNIGFQIHLGKATVIRTKTRTTTTSQ